MANVTDVVIVGGGFYGCCIAIEMATQGKSVLLLEKEAQLLARASYNNQARVHGGYHYPRSFLTGIRSRDNFERFVSEFQEAIVKDFTKLYAIAKNSKVTAKQFFEFCLRIGAPIKSAEASRLELFDRNNVEAVFEVQEFAFNAVKLSEILTAKLENLGVEVRLGAVANSVGQMADELICVSYVGNNSAGLVQAKEVYICTYSRLNEILYQSNLPVIPLRHELTEMALVEMPEKFSKVSVTVMDGPFWSLMPFPARQLMTLSHVRYTPHYQWSDEGGFNKAVDSGLFRESSFSSMIKDASRFMPMMVEAKYRDSLWEVKTIMPRSDSNDSRPILFRKDYGIPGLSVVLGGKIDNIFDIIEMINKREC